MKLQLRHGTGVVGHLDAAFSLASALQNKIGSCADFSGSGLVLRRKTGSQYVQVIGIQRQNRVRAQARGDDAGIGDRDVVPLGQQPQVLLESFFHHLIDGYPIGQGLGGH